MMDSTSMSTPVTHGELQEVLSQVKQDHGRELREATAPLATKAALDAKLDAAIAQLATKAELQAAIAPLATKAALEMWGGAVVARFQHAEKRLDNLERGQEQLIGLVQQTQQQIQHTEQRLIAELARHTSAFQEATRTQIKASTEPFDDLPGRVSRLETEVFGPAPRDRRKRRRKD
jgi:chromosome segregation ATPase